MGLAMVLREVTGELLKPLGAHEERVLSSTRRVWLGY